MCSPVRAGYTLAIEQFTPIDPATIAVGGPMCEQVDACEDAALGFLADVDECTKALSAGGFAGMCSEACLSAEEGLAYNEGCWGDMLPTLIAKLPVVGDLVIDWAGILYKVQQYVCMVVDPVQREQMFDYLHKLRDLSDACAADLQKMLAFTEFTVEQVCPTACLPLLDELTGEESSIDNRPAQLLHTFIQDTLNKVGLATRHKIDRLLRNASAAEGEDLRNASAAEGEEGEGEEDAAIATDFLSAVRRFIAMCDSCVTEGQAWPAAVLACKDAIDVYEFTYPNGPMCPAQCVEAADLLASSVCLASFPIPIAPALKLGSGLCTSFDDAVECVSLATPLSDDAIRCVMTQAAFEGTGDCLSWCHQSIDVGVQMGELCGDIVKQTRNDVRPRRRCSN